MPQKLSNFFSGGGCPEQQKTNKSSFLSNGGDIQEQRQERTGALGERADRAGTWVSVAVALPLGLPVRAPVRLWYESEKVRVALRLYVDAVGVKDGDAYPEGL